MMHSFVDEFIDMDDDHMYKSFCNFASIYILARSSIKQFYIYCCSCDGLELLVLSTFSSIRVSLP